MYKSKIKIWIVLIAISLFMTNFSGNISKIKSFFSTTKYNLYIDIDDVVLSTRFDGYKKSKSKIKIVSDINNSDIVIKRASEEQIDGYTKYSNQMSSPIVMYVPYDAYKIDNSGFACNTVQTSMSSHSYIQKDLKIILEAFEDNKKYTDIGIQEKVFGDGYIGIAIPQKNSNYYEEIRLLIALTLNDYSYENLDDTNLQKRVDDIINKCVKYEDAASYIKKLNEDGKKAKKTIVLAPEYIVLSSAGIAGTSQVSYSYILCIPQKTISLNYDLYIKNTENNDIYYKSLFKSLTKKKFAEIVGIRNKEMDFDIREVNRFYYTINSIPLIKE